MENYAQVIILEREDKAIVFHGPYMECEKTDELREHYQKENLSVSDVVRWLEEQHFDVYRICHNFSNETPLPVSTYWL